MQAHCSDLHIVEVWFKCVAGVSGVLLNTQKAANPPSLQTFGSVGLLDPQPCHRYFRFEWFKLAFFVFNIALGIALTVRSAYILQW